MNYLTHFYFNTQQPIYSAASPEFHFGVALPDILSVYDRTLRFHPSTIPIGQNEIWAGIQNHLRMDAFFHRSDFFKNSYEDIRIILKHHILPELNIRPFFLAHILTEILLDHVLLKQAPDLAVRFYSYLDQVTVRDEIDKLEIFFARKLNGLDDLINKFLVTRFLAGYIDLNNLIYPINRMLSRTRQQGFDTHDKSLLDDILQPSFRVVIKTFPTLIRQFNREFLNPLQ